MAPCDSTLYGNPCCNQVMLVHKQILDKKTGLMKNVDFHQKDRWCKECKDQGPNCNKSPPEKRRPSAEAGSGTPLPSRSEGFRTATEARRRSRS